MTVRGTDASSEPGPPESGAGSSAFAQGVLLGLEIESVVRQMKSLSQLLAELRRGQRAWQIGAAGEASVVDVIVGMDDTGWHVLPDRHWPGTRRANIDVLVVGAGGVFVIDVKAWREVTVQHGRLWHGDAPADDAVSKVLDQTLAVEEVLAEAGLAPTEVVPLLVLAGRRNARAQLNRVMLLGEHDLTADLVRRGIRLTRPMVEKVVMALDEGCPPMRAVVPAAGGQQPRSTPDREPGDDNSAKREQLWNALVGAAAQEPLETWMTWLHPAQARLVSRPFSGPARIRGAAGTGKTVVALHRAKYLAARGNRVLFTSYLKTLAPVNKSLFTRIAPELGDRVEFTSVYALARRYLSQARVDVRYDEESAHTCWSRAWMSVGRNSSLADANAPMTYWRDEVIKMIKGRGLDAYDDYAKRPRTGRGTPLQAGQRFEVWGLYKRYQQLLTERGIADGGDLLLRARDMARSHAEAGVEGRYDAVIVDEAQDLSCVALQFLHALVGDKPDGLLIVGDGQQSIYPGGTTLAEAGISVVGRSTVLRRNYRNRELILRYALAVVAGDQFADLDPEPYAGARDVETALPGGEVTQIVGDLSSQEIALYSHLRDVIEEDRARPGDIAILVPGNDIANHWLGATRAQGVAACLLADYDGFANGQVKIGTYHRAKGLDFAYVYMPDRDQHPHPRYPGESDDALREREEVERRQLYVAMTRARDGLWMGTRKDMARIE